MCLLCVLYASTSKSRKSTFPSANSEVIRNFLPDFSDSGIDGKSYSISSIKLSIIARKPLAPVFFLIASSEILSSASAVNSSPTPSISKSLLYSLVPAKFV